MRHPRLAHALVTALALLAGPALAVDTGVRGKRLVIAESKDGTSSVALQLGPDAAIGKGAGVAKGEPPALEGTLDVFYTAAPDSARGAFVMPAEGWTRNRKKAARYTGQNAPGAGALVVDASVVNGKVAVVHTKGEIATDGMFDLARGAPDDEGGITTVLTITNRADKTLTRLCTRWAIGSGGKVALKTRKRRTTLTATRGAPTACPPLSQQAEGCEELIAAECLLPYPSSRFLVPASTPTGVAVRLPQTGIPRVEGPTQIPATMFDGLDGFSPGIQVLMHFPQGVDVVASNASRLLPAECCGQPAGPPWKDTRTYDDRSLEPDSPTVLLDADTGERVLHFVENDARATDPARLIFFLRPAVILTPGHRYVVAVRGLVATDGTPVLPEAPFRLLRDGIVTGDAAIEARRAHFESDVFAPLAAAGVARDDLILAFDFTIASEQSLHAIMTSMRDQAYAWLDTVEADSMQTPFTVTDMTENDCNTPGTVVWRSLAGTFQVPLFLTGDLDDDTTPVDNLDANGVPVQNGFHTARFFATIPCSVLTPVPGTPTLPVVVGHGLFQTGDVYPPLLPLVVSQIEPWTGIVFGTDWRGLSGLDLRWIALKIFGAGESQFHHFAGFPARLRQGMLNTLVMTRMMKRGLFNRLPAFQKPDTSDVLPGPTVDVDYIGFSLGGIMGTYFAGLTPDVDRFTLNVGAVNFSCLLQRATPFQQFYPFVSLLLRDDPMSIALGVQLLHELWASAEPVSVVHHVTSDPLPGSGNAKQVLYSAAWLDKQVSNTCTEIAARTMQLPVLAGSIQQSLQGMTDAAGPVSSALVFHHLGELDIVNPAHAAFVPPLANVFPSEVCDPHPRQASTPASVRQILGFFATGDIANTCTGLCDGDVADERPLLGTCTPG